MTQNSVPLKSAFVNSGHDHGCCRDKAIHTAEHLCNQRGVRFTPIRREVLELIWESHRAVLQHCFMAVVPWVVSLTLSTTASQTKCSIN